MLSIASGTMAKHTAILQRQQRGFIFIEIILSIYSTELSDQMVSNYEMNFRLGGCDWPGFWEPKIGGRDYSSIRKPSTTVTSPMVAQSP